MQAGPAGLTQVASQIGYSLQPADASNLAGALASLPGAVSDLAVAADEPDKILDLLQGIREVMASINTLDAIVAGFGARLLDYLLITYLQTNHPMVYSTLLLVGIFEETQMPATSTTLAFTLWQIHWEYAPRVFHLADLFSTVYGWGTAAFSNAPYRNIFESVEKACCAAGVPAFEKVDSAASGSPYLFVGFDTGTVEVGVRVIPLPAVPSGGTNAGLAIAPTASANLNKSIDLGAGWSLDATLSVSGDLNYGVMLTPTGVSFGAILAAASPASASLDADIGLAKVDVDGGKIVLFGPSSGTRVHADSISLSVGIHPGQGELEVGLSFKGLQLIVDTADADSFLQEVLGADQKAIDFGNSIVWSSKSGLHFDGSAGLHLEIPLHLSLAIADVNRIFLDVQVSEKGALLAVSIAGGVSLGPIEASVDKLGIRLRLGPPNLDGGAALGKLDLDFGFRPPDGLGLAIDAGPVSGGGYIEHDASKGEYSGVLELGVDIPVASLDIKVIGLLDTRLPGGQPGYSLLLIVTAQFPEIQLGLGFTLNGLGGLMGINRTMALEALQAAVKSHSLDDVLFPDDPVAHAPQILSEVGTIFPVAAGRYVFGPIVELGWGTPQIVQAEMGLILEVPEPIRLALLGQLRVGFPAVDDSVPDDLKIVLIKMEIVGTIDFSAKVLSVYGQIYDSKVSGYSLAGDLALMLTWGAPSSFAASIGGCNPKYQHLLPAGFPALNRVSIGMSQGGSSFSLQAYLAAASNSVQLGAEAVLHATIDVFTVNGNMGFDVLVGTKPSFHFDADIYGSVEILQGSSVFASLSIYVELTGPGPWHAHGIASFQILGVTVSKTFDVTMGNAAPQLPNPAVALLDLLAAAVADNRNWAAVLPPGADPGFSYTTPSPSGGAASSSSPQPLLVHPAGGVLFRQRIAPLETPLDMIDGAPLSDVSRAFISAVKANGNALTELVDVTDQFARGQFQNLSDDEKLSKPAYEPMPSGASFGRDDLSVPPNIAAAALTYDSYYIEDPALPATLFAIPASLQTPSAIVVAQFAQLGGAKAAASRRTGSAQFGASTSRGSFVLCPTGYVIADMATAASRSDLGGATTRIDAEARLATYLQGHPQEQGQLQVVPGYTGAGQ